MIINDINYASKILMAKTEDILENQEIETILKQISARLTERVEFSKTDLKTTIKCESYRKLGNEAYYKKCFSEALGHYLKALSYAENDSIKAEIYSNRSICAMEMKNYANAKLEAEMAMSLGYCTNEKRREKTEARINKCANLQKLNSCEKLGRRENNYWNPKLTVEYSTDKSRKVRTFETLEMGETLIIERASGVSLINENCCYNCLEDITCPIPCSNCSQVVYCSTNCQREDANHWIECGYVSILLNSGISHLALKILQIDLDRVHESNLIRSVP